MQAGLYYIPPAAGAAGGPGGYTATPQTTTPRTALNGEAVRADPSGGSFTVTLPTGSANARARVCNVAAAGTNTITIDPGAHPSAGANSLRGGPVVLYPGQSAEFYCISTGVWCLLASLPEAMTPFEIIAPGSALATNFVAGIRRRLVSVSLTVAGGTGVTTATYRTTLSGVLQPNAEFARSALAGVTNQNVTFPVDPGGTYRVDAVIGAAGVATIASWREVDL